MPRRPADGVVLDSQVAGQWRRTVSKNGGTVDVQMVVTVDESVDRLCPGGASSLTTST
jgi:hypothetical protein